MMLANTAAMSAKVSAEPHLARQISTMHAKLWHQLRVSLPPRRPCRLVLGRRYARAARAWHVWGEFFASLFGINPCADQSLQV